MIHSYGMSCTNYGICDICTGVELTTEEAVRDRLINNVASEILFIIAVLSRPVWKRIGLVLGFQFRNLPVNCAGEENLRNYSWVIMFGCI